MCVRTGLGDSLRGPCGASRESLLLLKARWVWYHTARPAAPIFLRFPSGAIRIPGSSCPGPLVGWPGQSERSERAPGRPTHRGTPCGLCPGHPEPIRGSRVESGAVQELPGMGMRRPQGDDQSRIGRVSRGGFQGRWECRRSRGFRSDQRPHRRGRSRDWLELAAIDVKGETPRQSPSAHRLNSFRRSAFVISQNASECMTLPVWEGLVLTQVTATRRGPSRSEAPRARPP